MKYLPKNKLRNKIYLRTLLSYITVVSISLIMLGVLCYLYIAHLTEKQIEDMYQRAIVDISANTDNVYKNLQTLSAQISSMYWVKKYIYSDPSKVNYDTMDVIEISYAVNELTMFTTTSPMICGIALYFDNKDMVLSSYGRERGTRFFKECIKYEGKGYDDWMELLSNQNSANVILTQNIKIYNTPYKVITYIQSLPPHYKSSNASLIYFIDVKKIEKILKSNSVLQDGSISVLSPDFQTIGGDLLSKEDKAALQTHMEKDTSGGQVNQMISLGDNKERYLFYSKSTVNGWYYVAIVPGTKSIRAVQKFKLMMLFIGTIYLMIGLIAAFVFTRHNNKPIDRIISLCCSKLYKESDCEMDFDLLEKSILDMNADKKRNEKKIEIYMPIVRNAWLAGLLKGENFIESGFDEISQVLDIKFDYSNFLCAAVKLEKNEILGDRSIAGLYENMKQMNVAVYFCDLDTYLKAVIMNFNRNANGYSVADDVLSYLEQIGLNYTCAGLSRIFDESARIPDAFNEAITAFNHKVIHNDNKVIIYEDWESVKDPLTTLSLEEDVISCLKAGAAQKAHEMSTRLIDQSALQQKMTLHQVKYLYFSFASIGLKALNKMNILEHPSIYPEHMFSTDDTDKLKGLLLKFYEEVCSIMQAQKQKDSDLIVNSIIDYIIENLSSNQLCLMAIAEHFKLSSSYLSRYFKSQTKINLTEFINEKRIVLSKQYLSEGYSVLDTARLVGYDNDITFRRIFKKMIGITPGRYEEA